jgi:hypothetical protein
MVLRAEKDFTRHHRILGLLIVAAMMQFMLNSAISRENYNLLVAVSQINARQNIYVVENARRGVYDPLPEASKSRAFVDFLVNALESYDKDMLPAQLSSIAPYINDGLFTRIRALRLERVAQPDSASLFTMDSTPQFIPSPDPKLQTVRIRGNLQTLVFGVLQEVQPLEIVLTYTEAPKTMENQFGFVVTDYEVRKRGG